MPASERLVIEAGYNPARLRLDLAGGEVIYLDLRVTHAQGIEVGVAPPVRASLVQDEATPAVEEPLCPFDDPNFSQRLISHMHRAKRQAIAEAREAGLHGDA